MAKKTGMKNNNFLWGIVAVLGLAAGGLVLTLFLNLIQTETYYVLNEDVPSRSMIYPEMLTPVQVSKGGAPESAIGLEDVQAGGIFSSYPLLSGDILTASNVGTREDISVGVPDEWVITNFSVSADNAAGGRIQRGYYFDMLVVGDQGAFYPFINILALDTTVDMSGASNSRAAETEEAQDGMTTQYVVGLSPQNAAKLHQITSTYTNIKLVISPRQNEYEKPRIEDYEGIFTFNPGEETINLGEGTDYTFTVLERDAFGRLVEELVNYGDGNAVISNQELCKDVKNAPRGCSTGGKSSQSDSSSNETVESEESTESTDSTEPTETPVPTN